MHSQAINDILNNIPHRYELRLTFITDGWTIYCTTCNRGIWTDSMVDLNKPIALCDIISIALKHESDLHNGHQPTTGSYQKRLPL